MKKCAIDSDECLGDVADEDVGPLCQFHSRALCEIGETAFREWYSIEPDARKDAA